MEPLAGAVTTDAPPPALAPEAAATMATAPPPPPPVAHDVPAAGAAPVGAAFDGVFANAVPKSDLPPKYSNEPLPTYGDVVETSVPLQGYSGAVVITPTSELEDIRVDGLPVGRVGTFVCTFFVSWFFGFIGFMCAFLVSATHAGRNGARAGLGMQMLQWGLYMRSYMLQVYYMPTEYDDDGAGDLGDSDDGHDHGDSDGASYDDYDAVPLWLSYVFIIVGWLLFVHACSVFYNVRRAVRSRQLTMLAA